MHPHFLKIISGLIVSYVLGSIPTAYLFGRLYKGMDLRKHGSGNLGATNAFRVLGKGIGTTVLAIDILKGTASVLLAGLFFYSPDVNISRNLYLCLAAIFAVCGHNWTIFLKFKGGKGIATSLGALIGFSILIDQFATTCLIIVVLWLIIFLSTGFVSLGSVICSVFLPVLGIIFHLPVEILLFLTLLSVFSIVKHKSNIFRLLQKKESRFNTKKFLANFIKKTLS
ncbi:MAG: glycerol-3-phosphate 1-O-acyltransferase PlsY [Candidatus Omnitrophota bacterium]